MYTQDSPKYTQGSPKYTQDCLSPLVLPNLVLMKKQLSDSHLLR